MGTHGITFTMSENPNHYIMIYGALCLTLVFVAAFFNKLKNEIFGWWPVIILGVLGIIFITRGYHELRGNYHVHNSLNLNLKRKELGLELKIPKNEKLL